VKLDRIDIQIFYSFV